jgi:uncharacterized damage-inducible protein DinB
MMEQLIETWHINNRVNLYMLDAIAEEALKGVASNGGRSVAAIFAHLHQVRLMWLEASAPELAATQEKIPAKTKADKDAITKDRLRTALLASGEAAAELLKIGFETGRIKNFKPHPSAFLGYLLSHEGYHRGEIGIILAQAGTPLDEKVSYGMWEWGVR